MGQILKGPGLVYAQVYRKKRKTIEEYQQKIMNQIVEKFNGSSDTIFGVQIEIDRIQFSQIQGFIVQEFKEFGWGITEIEYVNSEKEATMNITPTWDDENGIRENSKEEEDE